tara:strand:+ start:546 stop:737 length:192 start_codon:yes stop_codon:yes gene_type:complete
MIVPEESRRKKGERRKEKGEEESVMNKVVWCHKYERYGGENKRLLKRKGLRTYYLVKPAKHEE